MADDVAAAAAGEAPPAPPTEAPKLEAKKSELADSNLTVDVLILMDCTGSMGSYIEAAKRSALKTAHDIHDEAPNTRFRLGFVGYRDLCDPEGDRYIVIPLSEDVAAVERALAPVAASGGGDTPEDVVGGLVKVLEAEWRGDTRIVLMVADAPCHGREFHSCDDSYPAGDPSGTDPRDQIKELARRGMDVYFMRCAHIVDTMVTKFEAAFSAAKVHDTQIFAVLDLASQGGAGAYVGEIDYGFGGGEVDEECDESAPMRCTDDAPPPPAPPPPWEGAAAAFAAPPCVSAPCASAAPSPRKKVRECATVEEEAEFVAPVAAMPRSLPSGGPGGGGGGGGRSAYEAAVTDSIKRSMRAAVARSSAAT